MTCVAAPWCVSQPATSCTTIIPTHPTIDFCAKAIDAKRQSTTNCHDHRPLRPHTHDAAVPTADFFVGKSHWHTATASEEVSHSVPFHRPFPDRRESRKAQTALKGLNACFGNSMPSPKSDLPHDRPGAKIYAKNDFKATAGSQACCHGGLRPFSSNLRAIRWSIGRLTDSTQRKDDPT
jgi:hypothetical protein